jgi:hypothetical protein
MPLPTHENSTKRTSGVKKKREPTEYCNFKNVEKIVNKSDNSEENIQLDDIESTVKELRNISCAIRRTSVVMPEFLRIFHKHGFNEELISVIDELAYAIHDTTVAVRTVTRSLDNR